MIVRELQSRTNKNIKWEIALNKRTQHLANQGNYWVGLTPNIPGKILQEEIKKIVWEPNIKVLYVYLEEVDDDRNYMVRDRNYDPILANKKISRNNQNPLVRAR